MADETPGDSTRMNEWFVPKFGSLKFRATIGLLFLPYTGVCVSFAIIGSLLASTIHWDRVMAIAIIYALALGVAAHAADALGSKKVKPWARLLSRHELVLLILVPIGISYAIGLYYIVFFVPGLALFAVLEGFLLFAYNFELFGGAFHNNLSFAFSWGTLPVLAGYAIEGSYDWKIAIAVSVITATIAYYHIRTSRSYKSLKRGERITSRALDERSFEKRLQLLCSCVIGFTVFLVALRGLFS